MKNYFTHQQQTATAALNAYSSAAAIPVVGYIIAPIAAAMAVAAGAMQVAAIKKQQASQAQGYGEGGFTRKGRADEVAGVVHAGEWVASQKLVASPVARPLIEALDYAQRTNTIGSLRSADVSRSRADGFGAKPTAGDSPGEQRLERYHRPSQRAIGRALRHRGHRDRRQGHKNLCKSKAKRACSIC